MTELPALTGSEKQIAWATKIRSNFVALLSDPYNPQMEYIEQAKLITDGAWWIDQRHLLDRPAYAAKNIKRAIRAALRPADA